MRYIQEFDKNYKTMEEFMHRMTIYRGNYLKINEINERDGSDVVLELN